DLTVTGVQTCALPISPVSACDAPGGPGERLVPASPVGAPVSDPAACDGSGERLVPVASPRVQHAAYRGADAASTRPTAKFETREIGRASCRERVERTG